MVCAMACALRVAGVRHADETDCAGGRCSPESRRATKRRSTTSTARACGLVFAVTLRVLRDVSSAEDVTLEVYLQVWRKALAFDAGRGTASAWLFMLARSRAIDRLRSPAQRARDRQRPLEELAPLRDTAPDPEEAADLRARRDLVRSALAALSKEQREVIELAYFEGLSQSEIAAKSGAPLGTVKTRMRLGLLSCGT